MSQLAGDPGVRLTRLDALRLHLSTMGQLLGLFARRGRYFLLPLVGVLLLGSVLLVLTELFPAFAPFVYAVF